MPGIFRFSQTLKIRRPSLGLFLVLMGLLVPLLIAACGGDDPTAVPRAAATTQPSPTAAAPAPTATTPDPTAVPPAPSAVPDPTIAPDPVTPTADMVEVSNQGSLGPHLVDSNGMTLYLFTKDVRNVSNCSGGCADAWPPLMSDGDITAGDGVNADRLSTIDRADGSSQVSYNGYPLYYFANDVDSGDTLGQDRGGVWFLVSPDGGAIFTSASVNATENSELGTILTDPSGRSLYQFTKDAPNVSNCAGNCAPA